MRYLDEFRDGQLARGLAAAIAAEVRPERDYRLMEFCGGHTHAIFRHGLPDLLPPNLCFIHGPGCPVCVLPMARIDQAIAMAQQHALTLCTYGDLLRVPASGGNSLLKAKAAGADIRMVYSTQDALAIARAQPARQTVWCAIGFETTAPATAVALHTARAERLSNFAVFCNHVLTPPALSAILADEAARIDGILGPAHVSSVIGSEAYAFVAAEFGKPVVIAGFEPLDVLHSTLLLVRQINAGQCRIDNQYRRAVTPAGNRKAQDLLASTLTTRARFAWRGLGELPDSALQLAEDYAEFDAERRFPTEFTSAPEPHGCICAQVLRGHLPPSACRLFGTVCTPHQPIGACMVSAEGACAAYWSYGRFRSIGDSTPPITNDPAPELDTR